MDAIQAIWDSFVDAVATWFPLVIAALAILLFGWIVAKLVAGLTRKLLHWAKLDARLAKGAEATGEKPVSVENMVAQFVYYLIIFVAILAALNALGMTGITALFASMFNVIFDFLPRVIYAVVLAGIAWIVARLLRTIVSRALAKVGVDKRVSEHTGTTTAPTSSASEQTSATTAPTSSASGQASTTTPTASTSPANGQASATTAPISTAIGEAVYWLVWLMFLPAILGVLGLEGILLPIQAMMTNLLATLPSLLAAAVIIIVGLFIARVLQRITASSLHAFGVDAFSDRVGIAKYLGKPNLSGLIGYLVYIIVLIPVVIAALDVTGLTFLAAPLADMLNQILLAIPKVFVAAAVLAIAFLVGRVIADAVTTLLMNAGFDKHVARLSYGQVSETPPVSPSKLVGWVVLAVIVLFGALAAASMIGWTALVVILEAFIAFLARLAVGLLILVVGIYLANFASKLILSTGLAQKRVLALLARVSIIVFAVAMALDQIGVANDIVNLAFGMILAGAALAAALAFGLGGQDVAKYQLVRMYNSAEASLAAEPAPEAQLPDATLPTASEVMPTDASLPPEPETKPKGDTPDEGNQKS